MDIEHEESGALRVRNPNELILILREGLRVQSNGFLHAYVINGSASEVNFDNFWAIIVRGKVRQFNDYGSPCATASAIAYGLAMANENGVNGEYNNRYTSKELQTAEFVTGEGL